MYRIAKKPEVPSSTPDKITFPFDFSEFGFTMENYVRSFTRNRVSKEKILEVLDEVNATIQAEKENFNTWDTISLVLFILGSLVALYCLLTLRLKDLTIWLIKFLLIIVTIIFNICIWGYCQSGAISRMKSKIQFILDSQEDVYEEKGMKWSLSNENEFPFWIELHIQSEYEMKVDKNDKGKRGKGSKDLRLADHNTTIDSFEDDTEIISKRSLRKNFKEDHDEDEDGDDVRINVQRGKSKEREIEIQDKKYDNSPKIENSYQQQVDEDEDDDEAHIEEEINASKRSMQTPTSANQDQPRNTEGQFKEIANNIYDQVTSDHEADGAINKPEKIIASKSRQDDDLVEHLSEKPGSQAASVKGSRTQLDEVKPKVDPAEIGKTLRELHSKVDEVLRKNTGLRNSMYSGLGASTISERDRRAYVAGTFGVETGVARTYNNPFTGNVDSKGYDPILNTPVRDIRPNANIDINYLKYSQALPRNDRVGEIPREPLKYDKEKLDNIIGNILQRQGISYRPSAEARAANEMTHSKYSNFYQEDARSQAARRANESLHQSRIEAPKPYYYCGELENDEDSIILGYAKQVDEELRKKYNYHCGDLEDDDN